MPEGSGSDWFWTWRIKHDDDLQAAGRSKYIIEYRDQNGKRRREIGATDKGATQRIANIGKTRFSCAGRDCSAPKPKHSRPMNPSPGRAIWRTGETRWSIEG
jgi:hypothetical protein